MAAYSCGGYKYEYVKTPLDWLICKTCALPSREPYLSGCCGHTFCKSCLEAEKRATNISQACPFCNSEEFITIPHKQADRAIRSLHVFCTNKDKGCEWQGEVNDIINHLGNSDGCQFEVMSCSNDCGKCLQRQYLTSHVEDECVRRKVECQYCHITGEHQFIEGEHKEQCPKFPIACPNKCEADNIPREDIDGHRKMCPLEEITCPNDCGMTLQRQNVITHANTECLRRKVDCQYCHITGEHQFIEGEHKEQCPKFPIVCPNKCGAGSVQRDDVEEHRKMCPLELVQCEYYVVGCEERMARKDQKKHNKEKMEDHLFFITRQLTNAQHHSASGLKQLTTKITQTGNDLDTTKQLLGSAVKTIDQLIQRLQQTERDTASRLKKCKDELTMRIEQENKESKEQLAVTKDDLTLKLQQMENSLTVNKQELSDTKDTLKTAQERAKKTADNFTEHLAKMVDDYKDDITVVRNELSALKTTQDKAKKREDELTEELEQARKDATFSSKELTVTKQNIAAIQKEVNELQKLFTASEKKVATTMDKLEAMKLAAQKTKEELLQQYEAVRQENTLHQQFEDKFKLELKAIQQALKTQQEDNKIRQHEAMKSIDGLSMRLSEAEKELYATKQQLADTNKALESIRLDSKTHQKSKLHHHKAVLSWSRFLEHRALNNIVPVIVKMSGISQMPQESTPFSKTKLAPHIVGEIVIANNYSSIFYTHRNGYTMCLFVFLRGSMTVVYLSVQLYLVKGPYDDQLRWPLKGHCEVKLLNQVNDVDHYVGKGEYNSNGYQKIYHTSLAAKGQSSEIKNYPMWYSDKFISYEDLKKVTVTHQYYKDDSIFFEVNFTLD